MVNMVCIMVTGRCKTHWPCPHQVHTALSTVPSFPTVIWICDTAEIKDWHRSHSTSPESITTTPSLRLPRRRAATFVVAFGTLIFFTSFFFSGTAVLPEVVVFLLFSFFFEPPRLKRRLKNPGPDPRASLPVASMQVHGQADFNCTIHQLIPHGTRTHARTHACMDARTHTHLYP